MTLTTHHAGNAPNPPEQPSSWPRKWLLNSFRNLGLQRRELRAWAMYDWAKSAFETTIMAAMLPVYYADVAAATLPDHLRTAYWGYTTGFGLLIIAVLSPLLGAIADYLGRAKTMLVAFSFLGALASACLWYVGHGEWLLASALFIVGNIGYAGANVFYDALLPHVAKPHEVDRASTAGFALGYIGGGLLLVLNLAWFLQPEFFGFADKGAAVRASFVSVAIWWITFTWPIWRHVPEPPGIKLGGDTGHPVVIAGRRLWQTCKQAKAYKQVLLFLVAFWFYTDGIGTIIKMATIFGREIGIETTHLIGALLLVQIVGIPATFAFGALAHRIGAKAGIMISLVVYTGICVLGYFMTQAWHFWALAILVALVQGGSQALSRSLYATIIPLSKANEFFAFISVSTRFAGIFGPLLFGVVSQLAGGSRLSILFLISFFVIGMIMLAKVNVPEGQRLAQAAEEDLQRTRAASPV